MTKRWRPRSVRVSLTLWYAAATLVVLAVYAAGVILFVSRSASKTLDERLHGDIRWVAEMAGQRSDGSLVWFEGDDGSGKTESPWLQVWSADGLLLLRSSYAERFPIPESGLLAGGADGEIRRVQLARVTFRILTSRAAIAGKPVVIQIAASEGPMRREIAQLILLFVFGLPLAVAAAGLGGYSLARRALAPVDRMAERARFVTAERLGERLPIANPDDEFGRLATVFNDTLGRLESSFDQMRRFTADVSHEIRTPLTAIRSVGEVGLRGRRDENAYRGVIGSMLEEVDRLTCLVDRLLAFSRAGTGQARLSMESADLGDLAENVAAHLGVLAEEKRQTLTVERLASPRCLVDRVVLRQALINLVDNAIKYTPADGRIRIRVSESAAGAAIDVIDTGPGIRTEPQARVFDRFYRSSQNDERGSGLGLSIAKWAVEVNGGRLTLAPAESGTTFRITLPPAGQARLHDDRRTA